MFFGTNHNTSPVTRLIVSILSSFAVAPVTVACAFVFAHARRRDEREHAEKELEAQEKVCSKGRLVSSHAL